MGKLADCYVEIESKTQGFDEGLAKAEKSLAASIGRMQSMVSAIGIGLGTAGMVGFLNDLAKAGGDLNETISKTGAVFGNATAGVMAFADQMATQFGAVKQTTLDAASMFGLIAQGAGMTADQAAKLSIELVRLADDASSFYNTSLDTALEKIRAGLVGESEPLRAFGVMLSETAVQSKAMEMGLASSTKELTEQEKVLARVKLITEGLAKAQGDHARTMDSYNNQVKLLNGQIENFKANIGAGVAAGGASFLKELQDNGLLAAIGKWSMNAAANPLQKNAGDFDVFQRAADAAAGVQHLDLKPAAARSKQQMDMDAFAVMIGGFRAAGDAKAQRDAAAFAANQFNGGGFGAFGMFGNIGQAFNAQAMIPQLERGMRDRGWSGGWGSMSATDFYRAAQESINRPQDETAKQQLTELKKMNETLTKLQPQRQGVFLKGPA